MNFFNCFDSFRYQLFPTTKNITTSSHFSWKFTAVWKHSLPLLRVGSCQALNINRVVGPRMNLLKQVVALSLN